MQSAVKVSLVFAGSIALLTAIAHLSCIVLGPACFAAQMAPPELIESAEQGTWLAPVATLLVSGVFVVCGLFALSGAKVVRHIPLTEYALLVIATVCVIRGISTIPLSFIFPAMVSPFSHIAGLVWFLVGLLYAMGFYLARKRDA